MDLLSEAAAMVALELALFASVIFVIFGLDDLVIDIMWFARGEKDRIIAQDHVIDPAIRFVVAVPAWREVAVIESMLATIQNRWPTANIRILVGTYANDCNTLRAVARAWRRDPRICMVINPSPGPTTKGDCLNIIWRAAEREAREGVFVADALLIHDAEDMVDPLELVVLADALSHHDYAQIPVEPLMGGPGKWIARHYCDEFAEAHRKEMPLRSALGMPLPTAGVGCAFTMSALRRVDGGQGPFAPDCLTEDYELGIRLSRSGATGTFVRARTSQGRLVASRALFPHRIDRSVRQKTRWLRGIALDGWDRLGWHTGSNGSNARHLLSVWMLWRDRRVVLAAMAIACGYAAMLLGVVALTGGASLRIAPLLGALLLANLALLVWRLMMRCWHSAHVYGGWQGLMAVFRQPVSNIILIMTAWRAVLGYWLCRRGQPLRWDKTEHMFPSA